MFYDDASPERGRERQRFVAAQFEFDLVGSIQRRRDERVFPFFHSRMCHSWWDRSRPPPPTDRAIEPITSDENGVVM